LNLEDIIVKLDKNFLWGVSTSAYQIEGNNWASDYWEFERKPGTPVREPSGDACDHYHRYEEDIRLLYNLGFNAFRFGIEWARIEPEIGEISNAEIEHYRRVLLVCQKYDVVPMVTLLHHTLPRWLAHKGGWLWEDSPKHFAQYCDLISRKLSDEMKLVMTINQPDLDANLGYRYGVTLPGWKALRTISGDESAERVTPNLIKAHHDARDAIRTNISNVKVGLGIASQDWIFDGTEDELVKHAAVREWEGPFYSSTKGDDFVGVQPYTRAVAQSPDGDPNKSGGETGHPYPPGTRLTPMGYEFYPAALGATVTRVAKLTGLPIIVAENGVAADDDNERIEYIRGALDSLRNSIEEGVNVQGYFHWSLLDNFEWTFGYKMRFGLVEVDRKTFKRNPKKSAYFLGDIAKSNEIPEYL
jgi:beta-glucosidase